MAGFSFLNYSVCTASIDVRLVAFGVDRCRKKFDMKIFVDVINDVIIFWDYCSDPNYQFFWLWSNGSIEAVTHQLWLVYTLLIVSGEYWSNFSHNDVIITDFTVMLISISFSASFHMLAILNYSSGKIQPLPTYSSIRHIRHRKGPEKLCRICRTSVMPDRIFW